jgi:hypothetical protein
MFRTLFCFLLLWTGTAGAQPLKASWISASADEKTTPNTWYCYRKSFDLKEVPRNVAASIAVDTKYWLWINNRLVVYEGGLKRGPNPVDTYYDELLLSPYLQQGKNTISVLVWFWGNGGFSHHNSGRSALLFEAKGTGVELLSDASWKAMRYEAYQPSTAPKPNFRLSEQNISFDAQKEIKDIHTTSYNDAAWPAALLIGTVPVAPWNNLVKRNIPLFKFGALQAYPKTEKRGDTLICHLPYNGHFSPYLKVRARAGQKIWIGTDTYYLGALSNTDSLYTLCSEYITRAGVQDYESLGWLSGHEMRYVIPKGVEVLQVQYRESGYNTSFAGSFTCNDTLLNRLWKKAQRTLYVNMRDNYMDCPDRERAQWAADGAIEMAQAFYSLDRKSDALSRKLFLDVVNWQRPDSIIYSPVPETAWKQELPAQSLGTLSEVERYFLFTRDTATVRHVYPAMKKYLGLWKMEPNGQLVYRKGGWNWGDWGENTDFVLVQHGWYLLSLQTAAKMALLTGKPGDHQYFMQKAEAVKSFLNSADCWNGKAYRHKDYQKETDDRANALMVLAGVADGAKWPALTKLFQKEAHASPWMEKFVLEALIRMGEPGAALQRMKTRFREMVESPLTTLWEIWEYKPGEVHGNSGYNHAWSGGPLVLLSQYYAGIVPDSAKADRYIIKPVLAGLQWINASVPTVKGFVKLSIKQQAKTLQLTCTVPAGLTARLGVPKAGGGPFRQITQNGKPLTALKGLPATEDAGYVWMDLQPGTYRIAAGW